MAVKLNMNNLYELKTKMRTETAHYVYSIEAWSVGMYRLVRSKKNEYPWSEKSEYVKIPEIYRGYFTIMMMMMIKLNFCLMWLLLVPRLYTTMEQFTDL